MEAKTRRAPYTLYPFLNAPNAGRADSSQALHIRSLRILAGSTRSRELMSGISSKYPQQLPIIGDYVLKWWEWLPLKPATVFYPAENSGKHRIKQRKYESRQRHSSTGCGVVAYVAPRLMIYN